MAFVRPERWMLVEQDDAGNLRWNEVRLTRDGGVVVTEQTGSGQTLRWTVGRENADTKVIEVFPEGGGEPMTLVDFTALDTHFEDNGVIFKNRRGLAKEVKRYAEFSLS